MSDSWADESKWDDARDGQPVPPPGVIRAGGQLIPVAEFDPHGPDWRRGQFCAWKMPAGTLVGMNCPECDHAQLLHVGTDHCPVCELLYQATPRYRRQQMRINGVSPRDMW